jgi:hypothetical protein
MLEKIPEDSAELEYLVEPKDSAEGERPDQKSKHRKFLLGRELSQKQQQIYNAIYLSGPIPLPVDEIFRQVYSPNGIDTDDDKRLVFEQIVRIRERLGTNAIITVENKGYLSRRAVIETKVKENISKRLNVT